MLSCSCTQPVTTPKPPVPPQVKQHVFDAQPDENGHRFANDRLQQRYMDEMRSLREELEQLFLRSEDIMVRKFETELHATRDAILRCCTDLSQKLTSFNAAHSAGAHVVQFSNEGFEANASTMFHTEIPVDDDLEREYELELEEKRKKLAQQDEGMLKSTAPASTATRLSGGRSSKALRQLLDQGRNVGGHMHIPTGKCMDRLHKAVASPKFEIASITFILANTILMALEVQYQGSSVGYKINVDGYNEPAESKWPFAKSAMMGSHIFFNIIFVIELILRIVVGRLMSFQSVWIWLDLFLVSFGVFDLLQQLDVVGGIGFNPSMLRVIRLLRLTRLIKTLKYGRGSFHSLFLLLKSVQASFTALFWSVLLLLMMCLSFGMLINQAISPYFDESHLSEEEQKNRRSVFLYYGTFTRTMLTMFEITLGNWAPPSRMLADNVSEVWAILITVYRNVFCFAVINVIRAVFIMETTRVAAGDDEVAMMNKERGAAVLHNKLMSIFAILDKDDDGCLTREEFMMAMRDEKVKRYMSTLELDGQASHLWGLLESVKEGDQEPTVSYHDFVTRVGPLRGAAKAIDLMVLQQELAELLDRIDSRPVVPPSRMSSKPPSRMSSKAVTNGNSPTPAVGS